MKFNFDAVAISVASRAGKDGKMYYSLNVDQDGEIVTFDCLEDVAKSVEKYKPYHFVGMYIKGEYGGRVYSRMRIDEVHPTGKQS